MPGWRRRRQKKERYSYSRKFCSELVLLCLLPVACLFSLFEFSVITLSVSQYYSVLITLHIYLYRYMVLTCVCLTVAAKERVENSKTREQKCCSQEQLWKQVCEIQISDDQQRRKISLEFRWKSVSCSNGIRQFGKYYFILLKTFGCDLCVCVCVVNLTFSILFCTFCFNLSFINYQL